MSRNQRLVNIVLIILFNNVQIINNSLPVLDSSEDVTGETDDTLAAAADVEASSNVVVEPAIEKHVTNGRAHGNKVTTEEEEEVEPESIEVKTCGTSWGRAVPSSGHKIFSF